MNEKLNAVCPYFAMFPMDYPMKVIQDNECESILDPFCGRGTTIMAAALNGKYAVGVDSSKVAYSITASKYVDATPESIQKECDRILNNPMPSDVPEGEFWNIMYDSQTLSDICKIREALLKDCSSDERVALRAIVMGALHGPLKVDGSSSYLSNQFPRTYASKPDYSVRYWKSHGLITPPSTSIREIVKNRSEKYYSGALKPPNGFVLNMDSTDPSTFHVIKDGVGEGNLFDMIITSPPYAGMYSYVPDQWIRNWFVGGLPTVEYTTKNQIHSCIEKFITQLKSVWKNCESVSKNNARMAVRFGNIASCSNDPHETIRRTFDGTEWEIEELRHAGIPKKGRRQRDSFSNTDSEYNEIDVVAKRVL